MILLFNWLVGWLCLTFHQQRRHLETVPPFTVPCEGREARFLHRSTGSNPGPSRGSPLHYRCATPDFTNKIGGKYIYRKIDAVLKYFPLMIFIVYNLYVLT